MIIIMNHVYSVLEMILVIPHYESVLLSLYCYYYDTSYSKQFLVDLKKNIVTLL